MNKFEYYNPVRIIFGEGEFARLGTEAAKYGKKALLIKTGTSLEKLGVYDRATKYLKDAGLEVFYLEGVEKNPKLTKIEQGVQICKEKGVDIVIAVGGGSGIDTAKAVAYGALDDGDIWDFFGKKRVPKDGLPVGVATTIAAAGSEMNVNSVVTNDRDEDPGKWQKWSTHFEFSYPKFSIIDPELHATVPQHMTACGMVDMISHVVESYFDGCPDNPVSDRIGEGIICTVMENEGILEDLHNLTMRANLAWAATLALNNIQNCGRAGKDYDVHTIEHAVGARTDCIHADGLAVINPQWLYHLNEQNPEKFTQFAKRVFNIDQGGMSEYEWGKAGIDELKARFKKWGMPLTLQQLGVKKADLPDIARQATENPEGVLLNEKDVLEVLEKCYE